VAYRLPISTINKCSVLWYNNVLCLQSTCKNRSRLLSLLERHGMTVIQDGSPASWYVFLFSTCTSRLCWLNKVMWKRLYPLWIDVMGLSWLHPKIRLLWDNLKSLVSPSDTRVIRIELTLYQIYLARTYLSCCLLQLLKANHCTSCNLMWSWTIQWSCAASPHLVCPFGGKLRGKHQHWMYVFLRL
jgi:hypothetical protein